MLQAWQASPQAVLQHSPSAQKPVWQSSPVLQVSPIFLGGALRSGDRPSPPPSPAAEALSVMVTSVVLPGSIRPCDAPLAIASSPPAVHTAVKLTSAASASVGR